MCRFTFRVRLCGCEDPACKQRTGDLNLDLKEPGHIISIFQYRRISGKCIESFVNFDPDRLVLRYGMPANAINSTEDCRGEKEVTIKDETERDLQICNECMNKCRQPIISSRVLEEICTKLVVASEKKDKKDHKKAKLAAKADGLTFREDPEVKLRRKQRKLFREVVALPERLRHDGVLKTFDIPGLLHEGEKAAVYELAKIRTAELPRRRRAAKQEEELGLVFYARHFQEERAKAAKAAKAEAKGKGKSAKRLTWDEDRAPNDEVSSSSESTSGRSRTRKSHKNMKSRPDKGHHRENSVVDAF